MIKTEHLIIVLVWLLATTMVVLSYLGGCLC